MERLKIGILYDSDNIELCYYRILKKLADSDYAEISLLIRLDRKSEDIKNQRNSFFYKVHDYLDRWVSKNKYDYDTKIRIFDLMLNIPIVSYNLFNDEYNNSNNENELDQNFNKNLDIIISFGVELPRENFIRIPRFGIWFYCPSDTISFKGIPSVYWEVVKKHAEITAIIKMLDVNKSEFVIYNTSISAYPRSIHINRDQILGLASVVIPRIIKKLYLQGGSFLEELKLKFNDSYETANLKYYGPPSSVVAFKNLCALMIEFIKRRVFAKNPAPWHIIYNLNSNVPFNFQKFKILRSPKGTFWADPFVIARDNKYYLFLEEFIYKKMKGHISVVELDDKGIILSREIIIDQSYHLSYPFIFESGNSYYMIPESSCNKSISLYRCIEFPKKWEFVLNLMENISAVDTTLFYYENKWWLFTSIDDTGIKTDSFTKLFLFYSDNFPSRDWHSHPANPIVVDVKTSRSAGAVFIHEKEIYRPSQNCSGRYGRSININKITKLDENEYEEILMSKIEPQLNKRLLGVHTLNHVKTADFLDISINTSRLPFINRIQSRDNEDVSLELIRGEKPIKVLFFTDGLVPGGKERRLVELMKGLKQFPIIDYEIVIMNPEVHYREVYSFGRKIHFLERKTKKDIKIFLRFYRICSHFKPDVIHCWDSMTSVYAVPASRMLKIKFINGMVVDAPENQTFTNKDWFRARITFPFSDIIVGNSKAGLKAYNAPNQKSKVIYNGFNFNRLEGLRSKEIVKEELNINSKYIIGMVASFCILKDYKTFYQAAKLLLNEGADVTFLAIGQGTDSQESKNLIEDNLIKSFKLLGTKSDIESYINVMDICVLSTYTEGISNSILEYMALQKPVIATSGGGTNEIVVDNETGFLINPSSPNELAARMKILLNDGGLCKTMGEAGKKRVNELFSIDKMLIQYIDLYKKNRKLH